MSKVKDSVSTAFIRHCRALVVVATYFLPLVASADQLSRNQQNGSDIRCVLVGFKLGSMPDASRKQAGVLLTLYYAARIQGRDPTLDIENLVTEQLVAMAPFEFESEAQRCYKGLEAEGQLITRIGESLASKEQKKNSGQ